MDELDDVKCWRQGTMTVFCQPNVIKKKKLDKDTADKLMETLHSSLQPIWSTGKAKLLRGLNKWTAIGLGLGGGGGAQNSSLRPVSHSRAGKTVP